MISFFTDSIWDSPIFFSILLYFCFVVLESLAINIYMLLNIYALIILSFYFRFKNLHTSVFNCFFLLLVPTFSRVKYFFQKKLFREIKPTRNQRRKSGKNKSEQKTALILFTWKNKIKQLRDNHYYRAFNGLTNIWMFILFTNYIIIFDLCWHTGLSVSIRTFWFSTWAIMSCAKSDVNRQSIKNL